MKTPHKHVFTLIAAATVLALSAGCEKKTTTTTTAPGTTNSTTTVTTTPSAERTMDKVGGAVGDAAITAKVKTALLADDSVKGLRIDVDTRDGIVSLTGTVDNPGNIERAATLAKAVDGVKSVDNKLTGTAPR